MAIAVFGAGCFWCVEAIFSQLEGVDSVVSGYCNGTTTNPTYESVCSGKTGHAEVCRVDFNPKAITLEEILEVFWKTHDPTTLNKQGTDKGTQYRSAIYYNSEEQQKIAKKSKEKHLTYFENPIVTEITELGHYYKAEDYHQNYYNNNPSNPYCQFVIKPKLEKFKKR